MDEDRPWLGEEPSARADLGFPPVPTAIALFLAVASPLCLLGIAHDDGTDMVLVVVGLIAGLFAGVIAYLVQSARGGRGPDVRGRI